VLLMVKIYFPGFLAALGTATFIWLCPTTSAAGNSYHFLKEIPIGGEGGWDYLSIDSAAHRLYVTHSTKIVVIDLEKDSIAGEITDTPGVHGFALAPELGRGFSSNGNEAKVSIIDLKTLRTIAKIATGENPDAILYEPQRQEVYVFNGRGKSATLLEAKTGKVVANIPLPGKPEFATADGRAGFVYCNIEDKNEVVVIETQTHQIAASWPIAPGEEPTGMALDLTHHRLFVGCSNELMLMMNSTNGKIIASVPIGKGVDAVAFDPATQLAFSSNGEGTVTIAHEKSAEKLELIQTLATERGARTMALDSLTHKIYLTSARFEPTPSPGPDGTVQRPKFISGSAKVLIYGLEK
jgi:DNA-binding beta-propeller fold protein YncE